MKTRLGKKLIMFWEFSKEKPLFVWEIVEKLGIWHLLQCNLFDWDSKAQNKEEFVESLGTFLWDPNFNNVFYYTFKKFM
jgi:hypothetical protein